MITHNAQKGVQAESGSNDIHVEYQLLKELNRRTDIKAHHQVCEERT